MTTIGDLPWYGWDRTERVEIEVITPGTRMPYGAEGEPAAWREYGELRARGREAQIRRRRVIQHASPWEDMTQTDGAQP